jgi:hypothetical protein
MSVGARYRLIFDAPGDPHPVTPPDVDFRSLADALAAAWTTNTFGGQLLGDTCGLLRVMNGEDLRRAFERLRTLESECPNADEVGCARQVLREMGLA